MQDLRGSGSAEAASSVVGAVEEDCSVATELNSVNNPSSDCKLLHHKFKNLANLQFKFCE
jgi:hypothetical protein